MPKEPLPDDPTSQTAEDVEPEGLTFTELSQEPDAETMEYTADKPEGKAEDEEPAEKEEEPEEKPADKVGKEAEVAAEKKTIEEEDPIVKIVGKDVILKDRGKEFKLSEFKPEEVKTILQFGLRRHHGLQELATEKIDLARQRGIVEEAARNVTALMEKYSRAPEQSRGTTAGAIPKELLPADMDSDEVRATKAAAAEVWKNNQALSQRLDLIEGGQRNQQLERTSKEFLDNVGALKQEFPLASVEEVIAVHAFRPDVPVEEIVKKSHEIYSSKVHVDAVLKHNPLLRREMKEVFVKEYLADQQAAKTKRVPSKPSSTVSKPASTHIKPPTTMEEAGRVARRIIAQKMAEAEEDES
jgi:hypothetical protein